MTNAQANRMAALEEAKSLTANEAAELQRLRAEHAYFCKAFEVLRDAGFKPAWCATYIIANLKDGSTRLIHTLLEADLLVAEQKPASTFVGTDEDGFACYQLNFAL